MKWPLGFWHPETEDGVLRGMIRIIGLASLGGMAIGLLGIVALIQALANPTDGWQGVIVALIVVMGLGALLLGGGLSWLAHHAARAPDDTGTRIGAWVLTIVGLSFWWPLLTKAPTAPIDHYLALLRLGMLVVGGMMVWRLNRSRSRRA